jgi:hypothetical protein
MRRRRRSSGAQVFHFLLQSSVGARVEARRSRRDEALHAPQFVDVDGSRPFGISCGPVNCRPVVPAKRLQIGSLPPDVPVVVRLLRRARHRLGRASQRLGAVGNRASRTERDSGEALTQPIPGRLHHALGIRGHADLGKWRQASRQNHGRRQPVRRGAEAGRSTQRRQVSGNERLDLGEPHDDQFE